MRRHILSAVLSLLLAACGLPPNAPSVDGVATYQPSTGEFWVNGDPYVLPPGVATWGVRSGDTVHVLYEQQGDTRVVTRIDIVKRFLFGF
jgi:hypothetical protein